MYETDDDGDTVSDEICTRHFNKTSAHVEVSILSKLDANDLSIPAGPSDNDCPPMPCTYLQEYRTRSLVDSLVDSGENLALMDKVMGLKDDEQPDSVMCGWGNATCLPRQAPSASRGQGVRRKASKLSASDIDLSNVTIRFVSEDFSVDHHRSAWKAIVEPGTYRYIPNNGHYRMTKFSAFGPEWVTVRRSRLTEQAPLSSLDIRQTQKLLKKDLDSNFKLRPVMESPPAQGKTIFSPDGYDQRSGISEPVSKSNVANAPSSLTDRGDGGARTVAALPRVDSAPILGSRQPVINGFGQSQTYRDSASVLPERNASDPFSVSAMTRADTVLRPLEKLTPYQKHIDRRLSESDKQHIGNRHLETSLQHASNNSQADHLKKTLPSNMLSGQTDGDILSRLRNGLNGAHSDDVKSGIYSFLNNNTFKDYSRLLAEKVKVPLLGMVNGSVKSLAMQRKLPVTGKQPLPQSHTTGIYGGATAANDNSKRASAESSLSPAGNSDNLALPEISGKSIAVAAVLHHRIL
ncbi:hypothetical protein Btru_045992 [Bulinus truncatus]|nr:hypothetical protein Btru_045992 [Bulinus truncatus]